MISMMISVVVFGLIYIYEYAPLCMMIVRFNELNDLAIRCCYIYDHVICFLIFYSSMILIFYVFMFYVLDKTVHRKSFDL